MSEREQPPSEKPEASGTFSGLHGSVFDDIDSYHLKCSKVYGPTPTQFQSGVLLGIEIARGIAWGKRINSPNDKLTHGATP